MVIRKTNRHSCVITRAPPTHGSHISLSSRFRRAHQISVTSRHFIVEKNLWLQHVTLHLGFEWAGKIYYTAAKPYSELIAVHHAVVGMAPADIYRWTVRGRIQRLRALMLFITVANKSTKQIRIVVSRNQYNAANS